MVYTLDNSTAQLKARAHCVNGVIEMRWKHKYIVGMTVLSMFLTLPLVSADDDGDIVVFGEEFEPKAETVETSAANETPPTDSGEVAVETPEEKITETENPATPEEPQAETTEPTASPEPTLEAPVENVAPPEVQAPPPIEEIKPEIEVENLNAPADDGETVAASEDSGNSEDTGDGGNYADNPSTETPVEEIKPEVEVTPLSNDTPIENIPVEESTTYTEGENFYTGETPSTVETGNETFETDEPLVVTTNPSEGEFGNGEVYNGYTTSGDGYTTAENGYTTNGEIPVADATTVTPEPPATTTKKTKKSGKTEKKLKTQKARFVKLLSDDTYEYYLDRSAVRWVNLPYSKSEYMADVWIRMIEKNPDQSENIPDDLYQYLNSESSEITDAAEKGRAYNAVDEKVLRSRKYFLEHYYIRPKTKQVQFLCELEVIGRPQNAISERAYDYRNWEYLIPGSVESYIYSGVIAELGTGKAGKRGHMTFVDMLDEYARIALN